MVMNQFLIEAILFVRLAAIEEKFLNVDVQARPDWQHGEVLVEQVS